MNKRRIAVFMIIVIVSAILAIASSGYAFWSWSSATNKSVSFNTSKALKKYIEYDEGESKFVGDLQVANSYNQGIHTTIAMNKTSGAANVPLTAIIHMDIDTIGTNMKKSQALKWTVTEGNSNNPGTKLAEGNFIDANNGDTLSLVTDIEVTTTKEYYTVWIWLDENENPSDKLSGETLKTNVWTEINQIQGTEDRFEVTRINANYQTISATIVNSKYKVTHYAVTTTNSTPSNWTAIDSNDQNNIYNFTYDDISTTGTYYIWFKDSNNRTTSKSIEVTSIANAIPVCTWGSWSKNQIGNNETATITLTCTDTDSEITSFNLKTTDITKSNNSLNITNLTREEVTNGYAYTITVTGTEDDGETSLTIPANEIKNAMYPKVDGNVAKTSQVITIANNYTVTFISNDNNCPLDSTTYANKTATYGTAFELANPTCTGYTFSGWTANNGLDTTNAKYGTTSSTLTNIWSNGSSPVSATWFTDLALKSSKNITLTATWTANNLTFADQTLNSGTYGTAYTSNAFTGASNGTGSYTYTIKSGAPTGATINSTNRTISFTNSTNAGTYNVVITATDNNSGKTKDATMTIAIGRQSVAFPTCTSKAYTGSSQTLFEAHTSGEYTNETITGTNAGSYTGNLTPGANYQWNSGSNPTAARELSCTITQKDVTITAASQSRAWNGSALTNSGCTGNGLVSGHSVTCTMTSASTITTAGSADNVISTYIIKNSGNTDVTANYNVTTAKGTLTVTLATPTVSLTAKEASWTGNAIAANTATVSPNSSPTITYKYYTNSTCSTGETTTAPSAAGQYYAKAYAAAVTGKTNAANSDCVSHKITAVAATCPTLTAYNKAYDGSAHGIGVSGGSGGTIQYRTSTTGTWSNTAPTATNVSTTTVYVQVAGDGNHTTKDCGSSTITITRASVAEPSCTSATYDGTEKTLLAATSSGGYTNSAIKGTNAGNYSQTLTLNSNYQWSSGSNVTSDRTKTCTIGTKAVTVTAASQSRAWNGSALTNSGCTGNSLVSGHTVTCTMTSASTITTAGSADNVISTYVIKNSGGTDVTANYNVTTAKGTLTVTLATPTVSLTAKEANWTGSAIAANTATVSPNSNPTITYKYYTNSTCSAGETTTAPSAAGQHYAKAYAAAVTGKTNAASSDCVSHKINTVAATCPTLTAYSAAYDGSAHGIGVSGGSGGTVQYRTTSNGTWSNTAPTITNVSDSPTTVYVQVAGDGNHTTKDCGSSTITISRASVAEPSCTAATYDGTEKTLLAASSSGGYTNSAIKGTAAGEYSTTLTLNGNYQWSTGSNVTSNRTKKCSISQATGTNSVKITGTNTWGQTLTATITTNSSGTKGYQWYYNSNNSASGGTAIDGATSSTYTIDKSLVGKYIYVVASVGSSTNHTTPSNSTDITDATANTTATVAKQLACAAPTGVNVGVDKKVTWTASATATGYEISMSSNSGFTSHTSGSVYNSITDSAGDRTVYVRSTCNTSYYTNSTSSNASKGVIVHSVTLTKGTGIDAVSGGGNYVKGATVTLGATVGTGHTWSKWTQTSSGADVSTTNAYSATINGNWAYTANATPISYSVTYNYNENGGTSSTKTSDTKAYGTAIDLTPTATKANWTFVGWNTDKNATSALSSLTMSTGNVTLYAIYSKELKGIFHYYNNQTTEVKKTIYNKATEATITSPAAAGASNDFNFRHWSTSTAADAASTVAASTSITISANTDYYASYQKTVTGTFYYCTLAKTDYTYSNAAQSSKTTTATQYRNYTGTIVNTNFTIPTEVTGSNGGASAENYAGVATAENSATTVTPTTANTSFYAVYTESLTFYYYNGSSHTSKQVTRRMLSNSGKYANSLSETAPTPSNYDSTAFSNWSYDSTKYSSDYQRQPLQTGVNSLYAIYPKSITATFNYHNGTAAATTTASSTRYYVSKSGGINTYNTNITVPSAVSSNRTISSVTYTYRGVSTSDASNATVATPTTANATYYASYSYPITVSYNGNNATSGTTPTSSSGTGYMKYDGTKTGISVTTAANPYSRTGYTFSKWNTASNGSGTDYNVSTQYTFTASATLYAKWSANNLTFGDQTLSSGTYGSAYTSGAFTAASNGTGSYTYTIKSGAPTGATIDSANRKISFTNSTAAGTYSVVVTATDNGSSKTKDATMTITIGRKGIAFPTCTSQAYNGSSQELFAAHSSGEYINSAISGTTVGDYSGNLTPTANYQWNSGSNVTSARSLTCTITQKAVTVTATSQSRAWNNAALTNSGCTANSGGLVSGHSVTCTMTNTSTITTAGSADNVISTYTIKSGNTDVTANYNVTTAKGTLTVTLATPTVSLTAKEASWTGSAIAANTATVSPNSSPTITYKYYTNSTCSAGEATTAPSAAGQYYAKAYAAAVTGKTNAANSDCVSHKITAVAATCPTLTAYNEVYDGSAHGIGVSGGSGGTIQYRTSASGTWSNTAPTATNVSTTTVYVQVAGDGNHTTKDCGSSTITITRASVAEPSCTSATYDGTEKTLLAAKSSGGYTNSAIKGTAAGDYSTTLTLNGNYQWSSGSNATSNRTKTCTIGTKAVTVTAASQSRAWNGSALTNSGCTGNSLVSGHTVTCTMTSASTITTAGSVDNVISTYVIKNSGGTDVTANYNVTTAKGTLTVTLATPTVSLTAKETGYTGSAIAANTATASPDASGSKSYTYYTNSGCSTQTSTSDGSGAASAGAAPKNVGQYYVKATVAAVANKTNVAYSSCTSHKITAVAATISCSNKTYNGTEQTACSCTGGTIGGEYKATNYRSTSYSASCTPDGNHTAPSNKTWTMSKYALTNSVITAYTAEMVSSASTYSRTVSTGIGSETVTLTYTPYANAVGSYTYATSSSSGKFTLSQSNGNYSISSAGNLTIQDTTPPTISSVSGTAGSAGSGIITGSVSAADSGTGLATTNTYSWYLSSSSTCPTTNVYTSNTNTSYEFNVTSGGTYYVCIKATDKAGNTSNPVASSAVSYTHTVTCSAGNYYKGSTGSCTQCPAGSYCTGWTGVPDSSNHGITACQTGSISANGASSCTACGNGTTTSGTGQTSCNATCSNTTGVYSWATASWSNGTVSNSCTVSTCNANYKKGSNACSACDAGEYTKAGNTSTSCTACTSTGVNTWAGAGQGCVAASCSTNYKRSGNGCAACGGGYYSSNGNTSASCSTCSNNNGHVSSWSGNNGCTISSCASGYTNSNNTCVAATCTVYCTSTSSCSTTRPSGDVLYGVFTCSGGSTGSISQCWYGTTQCDGGIFGDTPYDACTRNTSVTSLLVGRCHTSINQNININSLGLSGSGYSCSC